MNDDKTNKTQMQEMSNRMDTEKTNSDNLSEVQKPILEQKESKRCLNCKKVITGRDKHYISIKGNIVPRQEKDIVYKMSKKGCHLLTSHHNGKRVGNITREGKSLAIHRYIFLKYNGYLPIVVRHTCDNPRCINPKHLLGGDYRENSMDMVRRNRSLRGEKNPSAKLTEQQVKDILKDTQTGIRELGRKYKVSHKTIYNIKHLKKWRWINDETNRG